MLSSKAFVDMTSGCHNSCAERLQLQQLSWLPLAPSRPPHRSFGTPDLGLRTIRHCSHNLPRNRCSPILVTAAAATWPSCYPSVVMATADGAAPACHVGPLHGLKGVASGDQWPSRCSRSCCPHPGRLAARGTRGRRPCSCSGTAGSVSGADDSRFNAQGTAAELQHSEAAGGAAGEAEDAAAPVALSGGARTDPQEIARRIAASRARRASRLSYNCPACSISAATPTNIARHMARCCPDVVAQDRDAWEQLDSLPRGFPSPQHDAVVALLRAAGAREMELRRRVLACVFWSGPVDPETGLPSRLQIEEAALRLGLPLARASSALQRAMASVPLASDSGGPPLDIMFEDEHFLAVNKPVGLHTAPIHRFTGGSVVNKVIAYLNRGRGRRYGGSGGSGDTIPVKLLNPPPGFEGFGDDLAGRGDVPLSGRSIPELMPLPEPFTLMSSSPSSGSSSSLDSDCGAGSVDGDSSGAAAASAGPSSTVPYQLEPYVLHRLDMNTSGLLLFAKRPEVVAGMHRQFRERSLSKLYVAACVGCPGAIQGDSGGGGGGGGGGSRHSFYVNAPIDRHPVEAVARRVADTGKEAATSFAVLASNPLADLGLSAGGAPGLLFHEGPRQGRGPGPGPGHGPGGAVGGAGAGSREGARGAGDAPDAAVIPHGASLVLCAPHTGRTHQIRVHLHHVGCPIVGDDIYGVTGPWLSRQALHAAALHFTHPLTGRPVRLSAPLHDDMAACLGALGLPLPDAAVLAEAEEEWRRAATAAAKTAQGGLRSREQQRQRQQQQRR